MGFVIAAVSRCLHHLYSSSNTTAKQSPQDSLAGCHQETEIFKFSCFLLNFSSTALQPQIACIRGTSPRHQPGLKTSVQEFCPLLTD